MAITITQLRSFLAVVRGGSVTAAAGELVVSPPSVSAAVAALTREVGAPLLVREGRGVRPTAAGEAFAGYAADVLGLLESGARVARRIDAQTGQELRIAAVTTAAESFVPPAMRAFAAAHPGVGLHLEVGNRDRVLELVTGHLADVAIGGNPPRDRRITAVPVGVNVLVLIAAVDDPLAGGEPVPARALGARTWLLREPGSGTRQANEAFLAAAGLEPETLALGSNGAIKQAARAGLGISLLSRDTVVTELDAGLLAVIPVAGGPPPRRWYAIRSTAGPARPLVHEFIASVAAAA